MRVPGLAFVLLLTACTSGTPTARQTTPPPATTPRPSVTPYRSADPACRVARASSQGLSGQTFAFVDAHVGVVTQGGWLYRTTDGGVTWRLAHDFPRLDDVVPAGCATLYASTGTELHRSDDGGSTWRRVSASAPGWLDFVTPDVGYGARWTDQVGTDLLTTRDGGRHWRRIGKRVRSLDAIASDGRVLLVSADKHMLRSTDGGAHFAEVMGDYESALAMSVDGARAWALTIRGSGTYVLSRSDDAGAHWREVLSGETYSNDLGPRRVLRGPIAAYGRTLLVAGDDTRVTTVTVVTDGGTIRTARLPGNESEYGPSPVNRLQWIDARHAYATIPSVPTRLYETRDAGATWREVVLR